MKIKSIVDHTVKNIEEMIIKGKLKPGQKIKEQEISTRLGISRPPLREAFKILEAEGLIRIEPRRGAFVSELKDSDIWEIYTLKLALYSLAVTLAIEKIRDVDIEKLGKIVFQMEEIVAGRGEADVIRYEELNNFFHDAMASITGHGRLKKIQQSINNQIKRIAFQSFADRKHLESSCEYHRRILEAIKAKDRKRAEKLTREHILKGLKMQERIRKGTFY
ncbi:MAG: GntR family transcriptional regulator [Deltaproteobacteria bacterium]|nr:GntR family transcriptional regulator [Deltaproteobacteria bacterium]